MLQAFLLAAMLAWAPLRALAELPYYDEVAHDVATVALDPDEAPVFDGDQAREQTAVLLLAIAYYESGGFARDVDDGRRLGDSGRSQCLMQVQLREGEALPNRTACIRVALARVRESLALCSRMQRADRLGGYVRGHCRAEDPQARLRWRRAETWWTAHGAELVAVRW
jgi:hypothetical protein